MHVTNSPDVTFSEIASWDSDAAHCVRAHYYVNDGANQYITWLRDLEINPLNPAAGDAAIVIGANGLGGFDGGGVPQDTWIENVEMGGGNVANCGIALYNSAGTQIIGCDIISSDMSVATFPGPGQQIVNTVCNELLCGSRDRGCLLETGGGVVASFHCVNSWFSSTGIDWGSRSGEVSGLVINGGSGPMIDTLSFANCHFLTNWYDGVEILGTLRTSILSVASSRAMGSARLATTTACWPVAALGLGDCRLSAVAAMAACGWVGLPRRRTASIPPRRRPINSGRARCPNRDSRASSRADSWAGRRDRSPAACRWSAGPGGGAGTSRSRAAAGCPSTNCRWRKR